MENEKFNNEPSMVDEAKKLGGEIKEELPLSEEQAVMDELGLDKDEATVDFEGEQPVVIGKDGEKYKKDKETGEWKKTLPGSENV